MTQAGNQENPDRQRAVALVYDPAGDSAPRLVARGKGETAARILAVAEENGVPIVENRDLVEVFAAVELEHEIPPRLYAAVAEVLAFVARLNGAAREAKW